VEREPGQAQETGLQAEVTLGHPVVGLGDGQHLLHRGLVDLVAQIPLGHGVRQVPEAIGHQVVLDQRVIDEREDKSLAGEHAEEALVRPAPAFAVGIVDESQHLAHGEPLLLAVPAHGEAQARGELGE
jgi:hypothetical protein